MLAFNNEIKHSVIWEYNLLCVENKVARNIELLYI